MELHKGDLFWEETRSETRYMQLNRDIEAEVLIIGGGMTGALIAHALVEDGHDVAVIDKRSPGYGSSNGNTGIIQYNSDKSLDLMIDDFGKARAVDFYRISLEAMQELGRIAGKLGDVGYKSTTSLFLAASEKDLPAMRRNYEALNLYDFPAEWIDKETLKTDYRLEAEAAILTSGDAELNPFKMVQCLHEHTLENGGRVYAETESKKIKEDKDGFLITTEKNHTIRSKVLILATGYEKGVVSDVEPYTERDTTYSLVTGKVDDFWGNSEMIWDSAEPYVYFRRTEDDRIIAGGFDEKGTRFSSERKIKKTTDDIMDRMKAYFPDLKAEPEHRWQSVFAVSRDGIPFIDRDRKNPDKYFALGYGGNGTCYSVIASMFIREYLKGNTHPKAYTTAMVDRKKTD